MRSVQLALFVFFCRCEASELSEKCGTSVLKDSQRKSMSCIMNPMRHLMTAGDMLWIRFNRFPNYGPKKEVEESFVTVQIGHFKLHEEGPILKTSNATQGILWFGKRSTKSYQGLIRISYNGSHVSYNTANPRQFVDLRWIKLFTRKETFEPKELPEVIDLRLRRLGNSDFDLIVNYEAPRRLTLLPHSPGKEKKENVFINTVEFVSVSKRKATQSSYLKANEHVLKIRSTSFANPTTIFFDIGGFTAESFISFTATSMHVEISFVTNEEEPDYWRLSVTSSSTKFFAGNQTIYSGTGILQKKVSCSIFDFRIWRHNTDGTKNSLLIMMNIPFELSKENRTKILKDSNSAPEWLKSSFEVIPLIKWDNLIQQVIISVPEGEILYVETPYNVDENTV